MQRRDTPASRKRKSRCSRTSPADQCILENARLLPHVGGQGARPALHSIGKWHYQRRHRGATATSSCGLPTAAGSCLYPAAKVRETPQPTTRGARPLVQTGSFVLTDATQALRCCVTAWLAGGPKLFPHRAFRFIIRKRLIPPRRQGARKPTANIPGCKAALPNRFVCAYRRDGGRCVTAWLAGFANVPVLLARVRMQTAPPPPRIAGFMPLPRRQGARKPTANIPGCKAALPNRFVCAYRRDGGRCPGHCVARRWPTRACSSGSGLNAHTNAALTPVSTPSDIGRDTATRCAHHLYPPISRLRRELARVRRSLKETIRVNRQVADGLIRCVRPAFECRRRLFEDEQPASRQRSTSFLSPASQECRSTSSTSTPNSSTSRYFASVVQPPNRKQPSSNELFRDNHGLGLMASLYFIATG